MSLFTQFRLYLIRTGARSRHFFLSFHGWRTRLILWLGAIAVGATAALFARMAEASMHGFQWLLHYSAWLALVISPAGLVLAVWPTRRFFNGAEGSGIPQTIAVVGNHLREQRAPLLSLRVAFGKIILTTLGLASGASIGREGPSV